ncbi:MAG: hypothetical protein ABJC62_04270 [Frankiaceae bacterium]
MELGRGYATSTATPAAFFARWIDHDTWPEWSPDTEWVRLDGPVEVGTRGVLKPKGGPKAKFVISACTAIGAVADDMIWQADEDGFTPFRRRVRYENAHPVSLDQVKEHLSLTNAPNWGYQLRRGLVALGADDVAVLRAAMLPGRER